MNTTIWKKVLDEENMAYLQENITVPLGAKILSAHAQNNKACIWFEAKPHDPEAIVVFEDTYQITSVQTGGILEEDIGDFIGTVVLFFLGGYVLHIYAKKLKEETE